MEKHINVIAVLHIILSVLGILTGMFLYAILHLIGDFTDDYSANLVLSIIANVLSVVFVVFSIPGIIGGIGLFKRKKWARILILIISVLDLLSFPFGTALGIYSIWALVQPEIIAEFEKETL